MDRSSGSILMPSKGSRKIIIPSLWSHVNTWTLQKSPLLGTLYTRFTYWTWGSRNVQRFSSDQASQRPQRSRARVMSWFTTGKSDAMRIARLRRPHMAGKAGKSPNVSRPEWMSTDGEPLPFCHCQVRFPEVQLNHLSHLNPTENSRSWSVMPFTWYAPFLQLLVLGSAESCFRTWSTDMEVF